MRRRAVRRRAERRTWTAPSVRAMSISTVKKPVGCSTSRLLTDAGSAMPATSAAMEPGMTQAVATLTAPNTPIASCTRWGMKLRVQMTPPC